MIRLIASDIDGTLLPEYSTVLPDAVFSMIRELKKQGIAFCAASGRQYANLRRLFAPVADEIYYICENGAVVYGMGAEEPLLNKSVMKRELAEQLIHEIISRRNCEVLVSGANTSYLIPKAEEIVHCIRDSLGNNTVILKSAEEIPEDIIKVSAYCNPDTSLVQKELPQKWEPYFHSAVAGMQWLDFTLADKGFGIQAICKALQISPENVMAFGDNFNDVPMLSVVGAPVLMESAHPQLREKFPVQCRSVPDYVQECLLHGNF